MSIEHIGTNSMIADQLTKGLPHKVLHEHIAHMGVVLFDNVLVELEFAFWILFYLDTYFLQNKKDGLFRF